MNQEQNSFNTQGNNGVPNNQPLNNQSMGLNQQTINSQPQPTQSFQQPIMQEPTLQPTNTFESGNTSNESFISKPPKKMNLGLIIGIIAVIVTFIIIISIVLSNNKVSNDNSNISNALTKQEKKDYKQELEIVEQYLEENNNFVKNDHSVEQIVSFSHKKIGSKILRIDTFGVEDYIENNSIINLWVLIVYTEEDSFYVYLREKTGVVYKIKYNDIVYYEISNNSTNNTDAKENNNDKIDKTEINSNINFEFDGKSYDFSKLTMIDFIEAGWIPNLEYVATKNIEEIILKPSQGKGFTFLNNKYPDFELVVMAHNYTDEEGVITNFPLSKITFNGLYSLREKTLIPTLKLKKNLTWGDPFENAKKIYGNPKENNENESVTWEFLSETDDMTINDNLWIMFEEEQKLSKVMISREIEKK